MRKLSSNRLEDKEILGSTEQEFLKRDQNLPKDVLGEPIADIRSDHTAKYGELVVVDSVAGDVRVKLPKATTENRAQKITIKKISSDTNNVFMDAYPGDTIDGTAWISFSTSFGNACLICIGAGRWAQVIG